jgi:hypothetical protein
MYRSWHVNGGKLAFPVHTIGGKEKKANYTISWEREMYRNNCGLITA